MNGKILYIVLAFAVIVAPPVLAQVDNSNATYVLDFDVETEGIQGPELADWTAGGSNYKVDLVLQNAQNVIGVNCDIKFVTGDIRIDLVHEKLGDLNFDSISDLRDFSILIDSYNSSELDTNYEAAYDIDGDGNISLKEFSNLIVGYLETSKYWTDAQIYDDSVEEASHESVNITDPISVMNETGTINDIVAVLLRRPGDDSSIGDGSTDLVIATIWLTVKDDASSPTTFTIENPVVLDIDDSVEAPTDCQPQSPNNVTTVTF